MHQLIIFLAITMVSGRAYPPSSPNRAVESIPPGLYGMDPWESALGHSDADQMSILCRDDANAIGRCVPPVACAKYVLMLDAMEKEPSECQLMNGDSGVCCVEHKAPGNFLAPFAGAKQLTLVEDTRFQMADEEEMKQAWEHASHVVDAKIRSENFFQLTAPKLDKDSSAWIHQSFLKLNDGNEAEVYRNGRISVEANLNLLKKLNAGTLKMQSESSPAANHTPIIDGIAKFQASSCPAAVIQSRYRTADGRCNNLYQPAWGQSKTATGRHFIPTYEDGVSSPRSKSVTGTILPSARRISQKVILNTDRLESVFTLNVMQMAQFLDHDLTKTQVINPGSLTCCRNGAAIQPPPLSNCLAIDIPADDPFYSKFGERCMEFLRSAFAVTQPGSPAWSSQINTLTGWIDASNIYGSTDAEAYALRECVGGRLKTSSAGSGRVQLPRASTISGDCSSATSTTACFVAGDDRVNEQPGLALIHTVWLREHNRVAAELQTRNPTWGDEKLYQEARRFVIAEMQHIIYNEWLPSVLGVFFMLLFDLYPRRGFETNYSSNGPNPVITSEFSTAAFRFGHNLVHHTENAVPRASLTPTESFRIKDNFNNISMFSRPETVENMIRGLSVNPMQQFDSNVIEDLTNFLFRKGKAFGMDLMALNIQRGRDHGLPSYNAVRNACGLPKAVKFEDLTNIPAEAILRLKSVYASVDDIDLFVGGLVETPVPSGIVGQTFACFIGNQFSRLRRADRFFYELSRQTGSFTANQLTEIKTKVSYARILCDNSDISEMQPLAFRLPVNIWNPRLSCTSGAIPRVNLDNWKNI